jgi:hypothetical protein
MAMAETPGCRKAIAHAQVVDAFREYGAQPVLLAREKQPADRAAFLGESSFQSGTNDSLARHTLTLGDSDLKPQF